MITDAELDMLIEYFKERKTAGRSRWQAVPVQRADILLDQPWPITIVIHLKLYYHDLWNYSEIRGMEVPILYYNYRCHIRHYDDPNLRKSYNSTSKYARKSAIGSVCRSRETWLRLRLSARVKNSSSMTGWTKEPCTTGKSISSTTKWRLRTFPVLGLLLCEIEEYMSVGNSPMMMVLYLSPGIIKGIIWRLGRRCGSIRCCSTNCCAGYFWIKGGKQPEIVEVYWKDKKDEIIK